ncbi:MAG: hypothetical protein U0527_13895 [Candidatus Eisenbacteria bacterium]
MTEGPRRSPELLKARALGLAVITIANAFCPAVSNAAELPAMTQAQPAGAASESRFSIRPEWITDAAAIDSSTQIRLRLATSGVSNDVLLTRGRSEWRLVDAEFLVTQATTRGALHGTLDGELTTISVRDGDERARGVLIGSLLGLSAGAALFVAWSQDDSGYWSGPWTGPALATLGSVFGGAVVGSFVGRLWSRYRVCYTAGGESDGALSP